MTRCCMQTDSSNFLFLRPGKGSTNFQPESKDKYLRVFSLYVELELSAQDQGLVPPLASYPILMSVTLP